MVLWTDGSVSFLFGKCCSGVIANCSLFGTEATLSISAGPECSSCSAEACGILRALCWSRKHQQVCYFSSLLLLSDFCSVLSTLSSSPSFLLLQSLWHELSSLSSCSKRIKWVPGHLFLPGNDAVDELARRGALLVPSVIPCSLSLLLSLVSTLIFPQTIGILSHLNSSRQAPSISTEGLVLLCHARCVPSRLRCKEYSLLLSSYQFIIGKIENP